MYSIRFSMVVVPSRRKKVLSSSQSFCFKKCSIMLREWRLCENSKIFSLRASLSSNIENSNRSFPEHSKFWNISSWKCVFHQSFFEALVWTIFRISHTQRKVYDLRQFHHFLPHGKYSQSEDVPGSEFDDSPVLLLSKCSLISSSLLSTSFL